MFLVSDHRSKPVWCLTAELYLLDLVFASFLTCETQGIQCGYPSFLNLVWLFTKQYLLYLAIVLGNFYLSAQSPGLGVLTNLSSSATCCLCDLCTHFNLSSWLIRTFLYLRLLYFLSYWSRHSGDSLIKPSRVLSLLSDIYIIICFGV